jgi:hypothetical protein
MACGVVAMAVVAAPAAATEPGPAVAASGGLAYTGAASFRPTVPGSRAAIAHGVAYAPADAPLAVKRIVWAGNRIAGLPYRYGGGHVRGFRDTAYDCSGSVSFALRGARLIRTPLDSSALAVWGERGSGAWVTIYANAGHAYLEVAGIRLDTSAADDPGGLRGPRWRPGRTAHRGYRARHPEGL